MNFHYPACDGPVTSVEQVAATVPKLSVAAFEPRSLVNGPGVRVVLWVQGCGRRCPGCFNPGFLSREGGRSVATEEVVGWIDEARSTAVERIEGITFSGGEPFDQAIALVAVARVARERGLGVLIFTGHPRDDLERRPQPGWTELMAASDVLVAGPYEAGSPGKHALLASANQELIHVTDRYRAVLSGPAPRRSEVRIGADGRIRMSGFPSLPFRNASRSSSLGAGENRRLLDIE